MATLFDLHNPELAAEPIPAPVAAARRVPATTGPARGRAEGARAVAHANRVSSGWLVTASEAVLAWARRQADPWLFEEARAAVVLLVPDPPDARAWGGVASALIGRRLIERVGYRSADSSNGAPKATWRIRQ